MEIPKATAKDYMLSMKRTCREGENLITSIELLLDGSEGLYDNRENPINAVINCIRERFKYIKSDLDYLEYIIHEEKDG